VKGSSRGRNPLVSRDGSDYNGPALVLVSAVLIGILSEILLRRTVYVTVTSDSIYLAQDHLPNLSVIIHAFK